MVRAVSAASRKLHKKATQVKVGGQLSSNPSTDNRAKLGLQIDGRSWKPPWPCLTRRTSTTRGKVPLLILRKESLQDAAETARLEKL